MIEIKETNHGFTTMIRKPEYWTEESNRQIKRGFFIQTINNDDIWYRCTNDDEYVYIISDIKEKKDFESSIIIGLEYVIQVEFIDYIEEKIDALQKIKPLKKEDEDEVFNDLIETFIGLDCFYKTKKEIESLIDENMKKLWS